MYDFIFIKHKKTLTNNEKELKVKIRIDWQDAHSGYNHYKQLTDNAIKSIYVTLFNARGFCHYFPPLALNYPLASPRTHS